MEQFEERLKSTPVLGNLIIIIDRYPRLSAWVVLSVGIVALLIYEARDVGLTTTNWIALIVASILVAGLCIWIVSWEDEEEMAETDEPPPADTVKKQESDSAQISETNTDDLSGETETESDDSA